ncbi:double-strand break repair protein AddB [Roseomonas sp. OT10]|uniref:double-strand break repair protein AddB n=1 Tax=Roseomonas cutis TaxID=2897332 RepID=UPI001E3DB5A5|nr:double-strand break repair protein AddB [Roseomonas sp. OT10]UFN47465.1 double-strand break repair protein AddB [Roseomonas sp. OT10]
MNLYEIPAHLPFLDALARGVVALAGTGRADPAALARTTILLPTRRAARSLRESFLRASGETALLLPRMRPLAGLSVEDAEELSLPALMDIPPAVDAARRLAVLTEMVMRLPPHFGGPSHPDQAWRLALELATLLDEMALEGCDPERLPGLVPEGLAQHWQVTHLFLGGVIREWQSWLERQGLSDIGARRVAVLRAQAEEWRDAPPAHPVIAAGIGVGGTIPAAAELLRILARTPNGHVVLHGAGEELSPELWPELCGSHTHPLHGQCRLLQAMDATAADLRPWPHGLPDDRGGEARAALLSRALLPAAAICCWQEKEPGRWAPALAGLSLLTAPDEAGEAAAIALLLRETLETPGHRAALVTPDRDLARRVIVELARHGILADDSAGQPLGMTSAGAFLRQMARMVAEDFAPVPTLACLKHPLCAAGMARQDWIGGVRLLEKHVLRGPRPAAGLAGLRLAAQAAFAAEEDTPRDEAAEGDAPPADPRGAAGRAARRRDGARVLALLDALGTALAGFDSLHDTVRPPADLLAAHLAAAEALAATDERPGGLRLYAGEEGEPLAVHLAGLEPAMACLPPIAAAAWPGLFDALLEGPLAPGVRQMRGRKGGSHPRVQVLGLLEARLQSFDRVVLGALEESVWPIATDPGAWMSRPMRREFGLPEPEERIGRVAADFLLSALSAPEAILSRARKRGGSPTVQARWLTRLETFLDGQSGEGRRLALRPSPAMGWAAALDVPVAPRPCARPAPAPPADVRPRRLTVTDVWTLKADPYAWYAKRLLKLSRLDELDAEASGADYGSIVHDAVAAWTRRAAGRLDADQAAEWFEEAALEALRRHAPRPGLVAFWRPRLARIGEFLREQEFQRPHVAARHAEVEGALTLACGVRLEGRADRVDVLEDGRIALLDFKTGALPSHSEIQDGRKPQLPLEAAIAARGGFAGIGGAPVAVLEHWKLSGGYEAGETRVFQPAKGTTLEALAEDALHAVDDLAREFLLGERPFLARPHPGRAPQGSDYDHLARLREWGGAEEGAGE